MSPDTIKLLKECNAGVKMGVSAIEEVLPHVAQPELKSLLNQNKEAHQDLGSELRRLLNEYQEEGKDPNPVAKSMSWLKTNMMLSLHDDDCTIADLITDGCNMGVKSLRRYLNQYQAANENAKDLTRRLISLEQDLAESCSPYL